ncbi:MAG: MEDS domain-containing protein [Nitrososphaeraceae archaeon]
MDAEDAAKNISESDYGIHCLLIYSDLTILRKFYTQYIPKQIEDKEEIIQIMPFYKTEHSVRQTLSKGYRGINMNKVENEEKTLIIKDSFGKYSIRKNAESIWNANQEMVKYANGLGKKGISIIGDMGSFLFEKRMQDLIDYELCLPKRFEVNPKGICLYHQKDFDRLPGHEANNNKSA